MNKPSEKAKKVQIWHDNLQKMLEKEEKRANFNEQDYKTRILNSFDAQGQQKSFNDLVQGLEQEEVARIFYTTMMMIDTNDLKILKSSDDSDEIFKIELLKKENHDEPQDNIGNQDNQESK